MISFPHVQYVSPEIDNEEDTRVCVVYWKTLFLATHAHTHKNATIVRAYLGTKISTSPPSHKCRKFLSHAFFVSNFNASLCLRHTTHTTKLQPFELYIQTTVQTKNKGSSWYNRM